jgi:hypothetical protein
MLFLSKLERTECSLSVDKRDCVCKNYANGHAEEREVHVYTRCCFNIETALVRGDTFLGQCYGSLDVEFS